jgi:cell wall-associated NlpC family hydrolase
MGRGCAAPLRLLFVVLTLASAYLAAGASAATRVVHDPARKHGTRTRALARKVVAFARHEVGVLYGYGGSSRGTGFDCSGLVYAAYRSIGREIPRSSWDQRRGRKGDPL